MRTRVLAALLVTLLLSACELRLATDVVVEPDGGGTLELLVALDPELHELLLDAGLDPLRGIDELRSTAPSWRVEQQDSQDGGLEVALRTGFADPDEFARITAGLFDALDTEDGRLWDGLRLEVDDTGVRFRGAAGLVVPTYPGADGPVAFDEDDLEELIETRGDEFVRAELRVTLPGEVTEHDADRIEGSTLTWDLPIGELRNVSAASEFSVAGTPLLLTAVALLVATGTAVSLVAVRSRRVARMRREARRKVAAGA